MHCVACGPRLPPQWWSGTEDDRRLGIGGAEAEAERAQQRVELRRVAAPDAQLGVGRVPVRWRTSVTCGGFAAAVAKSSESVPGASVTPTSASSRVPPAAGSIVAVDPVT